MTPEETGMLLAICAAYDRRTVGEADVIAWYRAIGDLPYAACENAVVAHYAASRAWIMPADIRAKAAAASGAPHSSACRAGNCRECVWSWCACVHHGASPAVGDGNLAEIEARP